MGSKKKSKSGAKQYKVKESKKAKNTNKKKHSILKKVILILFALVVIAILIGGGIFAGIFFSDKWAITREELIANGNAEVYDSEGKQIAVLSAGEGDGNRKVITIDQMGKYTPNAYIAIEDKRFYEHSGVDILRTAKATISYILNRGSSDVGGGSTITQQLVKNIMKDKADTGAEGIERKIREMSRAYHIESLLNKTQIIEKYLNIIFVGGNDLHGVEYGARYYFDKSAKDLDLAESAFLAGINNAPNMYDPYDKEEDHTDLIKSRTKLVLKFMKEQNRISENPEEAEQLYNEAVAKVEEGFKFKKGTIEIGNNSYFVVEAVNQAAKDLAEEKDIDINEAASIIKSSGYRLYTTQVTSIQNIVIKEMAKDKYVETRTTTVQDEDGKSKKTTIRTNAGMTIIEPSTGYVVAMGGDLQQDQGDSYYNYATSKERQTGSSIKPLANIAPGLEEKIITASTVYDDVRTNFKGLTYLPQNAGGYQGLCTVRKGIEVSSNIVNLKIMINVGTKTAIQYLNEFGLDTYVEGEDGLTLAIGGATHGSSTLQMAAAYATLANGGEYIEPTFYKKLVDSAGRTVLEPKQEKRRVISEANAFIISDILTDVVTGYSGTAPECAISGMDVAAKTGTTEAGTDKWLCGYTPYYAAATWYGYGYTNQWSVDNTSAAKNIWAGVMKQVHKKLDNKRFEKPSEVVTARVCRNSGKLATAECKNTYTEYFVKGTVPKACDGHVKLNICKESGKIATDFCLETEEKIYTAKPEKENNVNWSSTSGNDKYKVPEEKCNIHTEESNTVIIANLIGKTEEEAKTILADLSVQVIYETHSEQENGIVIRQSLSEGTKVQKGTTIVITINKTETKPPIDEENTNTNTNTEEPSNSENSNSQNNEQTVTNTEENKTT